jgi:hypothetical protein
MTSGRIPGFLLRAGSTHLSRMYFIPARVSLSPCRFGNSGYECLLPPVKPASEMYWRTMDAVGAMSGTMRVLPPLPVIEHTTRYNWLCAALLLTGGYRLNQAVFAWTQFESVPMFEIVSLGLLYPLSLSAWTVGWSRLLNIRNVYWAKAFTVVTILYLGLSLTQHWYAGSMPLLRSSTTLHIAVTSVRLFYLVSTCWLLYLLIRSKCRSSALLCVLVVLASMGQFAPELSAIGVPGIWFPFDTGVSRAQFAYALFFICAAVALWGEFLHIAERKAKRIESLDGGDAVAIPMKGRAL